MLTDEARAIEAIERHLDTIGVNNKKVNETAEKLYEAHNMSKTRTMDILTHRASIDEVKPIELFCLMECTDHKKLYDYFTEAEINDYEKFRFSKPERFKLPIKIKCQKVADDQYIGTISVDTLMKLRDAQMINYNANAQRVQHLAMVGGMEVYKISLNRKAVRAIKDSFKNNTYIPNTITLNIPVKETSMFEYNDNTGELVIKSIDAFDITDGYHRYIAMAQLHDADENFDYPMELRITNFTDDKSRSFIWQEDQKTKMSKVDSDSMNMNNSANIVLSRMLNDSQFVFKDSISRGEGNISYGQMSAIVDYLWFKGKTTKNVAFTQLQIQKQITDGMNQLAMNAPDLLNTKLGFAQLCIILYGINEKKTSDVILKALNKTDELTKSKFVSKIPRVAAFNEIKYLYERM